VRLLSLASLPTRKFRFIRGFTQAARGAPDSLKGSEHAQMNVLKKLDAAVLKRSVILPMLLGVILTGFAGPLALGHPCVQSPEPGQTKQDKKKEKERRKQEMKKYEDGLRAEALDIFREGQDLEAANDLHRAYLKYRDAEAKYRTKEISESKKRVREAIRKKTSDLVSNAVRLEKSGQWDAAIAALKQAQQYDPGSALLSYDLAVTYAHKGEIVEALRQIDESINELGPGKKRDQLEDLRVQLITNSSTGNIPADAISAVLDLNRAVKGDNTEFRRIERDPTVGREPCKQVETLKARVKTPSLTYDRARCAELDQNLTNAVNLLEQYLSEAQHAVDEDQVRHDISRLRMLLTLPKSEPGDNVRQLYADFERYLDKHRLDLATKALEQANTLMPEFTESLLQLAMLCEQTGDVAGARRYYRAFIGIEKNDTRRTEAEASEARLNAKTQTYKAYIDDARMPLAEVEDEFLQWGRKPRVVYVEERLERVGQDLQGAMSIFPLGPEVNELLSMVYLIANKQELAKRCFDVLWSQGWPVSFFTGGGSRVIISATGVAIVERGSSSYLWQSTVIPFASELKDVSFATVRGVDAGQGIVAIKEDSQTETISPARYGLPAFEKGPFPRSYANQYARLFQRYLDVPTNFARESLTKKEIGMLLFYAAEMADFAYGISQAAKLYNVYETLYWGITATHAYAIAVNVHMLLHQRQLVLQNSAFKHVPTGTSKIVMRSSL